MARIITRLKELRNAEVAFISLVDRAATRIPFRTLKRDDQESSMSINLSGLGKAFQSAKKADISKTPAQTSISAVIVLDSGDEEHMTDVRDALAAQGFTVAAALKQDDGAVVYAQDDNPLEGAQLVKLSDQLLVAVKGFDDAGETLRENTGFGEHVAAAGFFEGLNTAFDSVYATVNEALQGSTIDSGSSNAGVGATVSHALDQFSAYVNTLVTGVPAHAFKADQSLQSIAKSERARKADLAAADIAEATKPATKPTSTADRDTLLQLEALMRAAPLGSDGTEWASMSTGAKLAWYVSSYNTPAPASTIAKADTSASEDSIEEAQAEYDADDGYDGYDDERAVKAEADIAALAGAVSQLTSAVAAMVEKVDAQSNQINAQIDEITRKSDATLSKVAGVVIAPAYAGDAPAGRVQSIAKSESTDPRSGAFDTAFIRKSERNRR